MATLMGTRTAIADLRRVRLAGRYDAWEAARRSPAQVRCECEHCGVHAFLAPYALDRHECANCGAFGVRPLATADALTAAA